MSGYPLTRKNRTIVCLCGSTRFSEAFRKANLEETLAGNIVLSIGCDTKSDENLGVTKEQKEDLDELHLDKISMSDEVLVLNVDGYIGESTSRELGWAMISGKTVRFLDEDKAEKYLDENSAAVAKLGVGVLNSRRAF